LRAQLHLTQEELAEKAEMALPTLQKIEYGARQGTAETRQKLAKALGVTVSYLVYGTNPVNQGGKRYVTLPDIFIEEDEELLHRFITMLSARRAELDALHNQSVEDKYDEIQKAEVLAKDRAKTERRKKEDVSEFTKEGKHKNSA